MRGRKIYYPENQIFPFPFFILHSDVRDFLTRFSSASIAFSYTGMKNDISLYNTQVFSIKSEAQINPNLFSHKNF
jgi:hypothetical protein